GVDRPRGGAGAGAAVDARQQRMSTNEPANLNGAPPPAEWPVMGTRHRVRVRGMQGVPVLVIVTVGRERVWLSLSPPFTWEAIMEPEKADELICVLELARDEARKRRLQGDRGMRPGSRAPGRAGHRSGSA